MNKLYKTMEKQAYKEAMPVMVFNSDRILIAIVRTLNTLEKISGRGLQSISLTESKHVSSGNYYFRYLQPGIEIGMDEFDSLTLEQYDEKYSRKNIVAQ
jgi:hypothetical protein